MVEIALKHIYKKYEGNEEYTVKDFNMTIHDREFIVFVGPSGCGKSTSLRMIAGLEDITEGELVIDGKVVNNVPAKDRDIAMVFQNYALYPHMSVYDNMAFGLKIRRISKEEIDQRVKNAAEILNLTEYLDKKPAALSGGQRQRVALGRAIVRNAKVFLMDEPLSNLDAKLRAHMRTELTNLHNQLETTTIYVTHDQTEAMTMASRIVIMDAGVIQQVGTPLELYDTPNNVFVANFIGSPSMNIFNVIKEGDYVKSKDGLISLRLTEPQKNKLNSFDRKDFIIGIRPEDIQSEQIFIDANPETILKPTVTNVELLGSETILYLKLGDNNLVAKLDARYKNEIGDLIELAVNMNKVHFFDHETKNRIEI